MGIIIRKTIIIASMALILVHCEEYEDGEMNADGSMESVARVESAVGVIYDFRLGYGASVVPILGRVERYGRTIAVAARGWDNGLWWTYKKTNGRFEKWRRLAKDMKHDPIIKSNEDGRLEIFFLGKDNRIYHVYHGHDRVWSHPIPFGNRTFSEFKVAANQDGRLEVFALNRSTAKLWHIWQVVPSGNWSSWEQLGNSPALSGFSVVNNADGRMQIFGVAKTDYMWTVHQQVVNGSWRTWHVMNYTKLRRGTEPAVGFEVDNYNYPLITLAVQTADNRVVVYRQTWKNVDSFQKIDEGYSCSSCFNDLQFRGPDWHSTPNLLFTVDDNRYLRYNAQYRAQGNDWSGWRTLYDGRLGSQKISTQLKNLKRANGSYYVGNVVFAINADGDIQNRWQVDPAPLNFGPWRLVSGDQKQRFVNVNTIKDSSACINVLGITHDRLVRFNDQNTTIGSSCYDPDDWKGWRWLDDRSNACHHECAFEGDDKCENSNTYYCRMKNGCRTWVENPYISCEQFPNPASGTDVPNEPVDGLWN